MFVVFSYGKTKMPKLGSIVTNVPSLATKVLKVVSALYGCPTEPLTPTLGSFVPFSMKQAVAVIGKTRCSWVTQQHHHKQRNTWNASLKSSYAHEWYLNKPPRYSMTNYVCCPDTLIIAAPGNIPATQRFILGTPVIKPILKPSFLQATVVPT